MRGTSTTYKEAGVDIERADGLVSQVRNLVKRTARPEVLGGIGHYAGLFRPDLSRYREPVLCASTDGVGTKLKLAIAMDSLEGLGQDLVAMSDNDILCLGADPLFFLDYFSTGHLKKRQFIRLIDGITRACRTIGCTLLGGETAEMPSVYQKGDFDLAGFIVGIVDRARIIEGKAIEEGDAVIGLASSGPHSNGFSLIRRVIEKKRLKLSRRYPPLDDSLGEVLLKPTRLYGPALRRLLLKWEIRGISHITGGGFTNIVRILPRNLRVIIERKNWPLPPIFSLLKEWGRIDEREMERVFNLGVGLVLVTPPGTAAGLLKALGESGHAAWVIGRVAGRKPRDTRLEVR